MLTPAQERTLTKIFSLGAPLITLFLIDGSVTDPVNTPKFFVLGLVAFSVFGAVIAPLPKLSFNQWGKILFLPFAFLLIAFEVLITSNAPLSQSIYGSYGRNNGFLMYVFLVIILVGASLLNGESGVRKIIYGLLVAGIVNLLYCAWVLIFGDFLSWANPYGSILGTLGNPNFIGAFLGIFGTIWFALAIAPSSNRVVKLSSIVILPVTVVETYLSHAIQGRVLLVFGCGLVGFYWIRDRFKSNYLALGYLALGFCLAAVSIAGALQKGPLSQLIYKTSVSLRGQYWLAGWRTGEQKPWTGVGFDSFGDWYRRTRDIKAITLPGVNTVVNTAHNVPVDMFAFGGWPLFVSYIALMLFVGYTAIRLTLKVKNFDFTLVSLISGWFCYQLQSIISINQIGLAIWGWLFSGLILGYAFNLDRKAKSNSHQSVRNIGLKQNRNQILTPGLYAGVFAIIGAIIAVPPLNADMKWRSALLSTQVTSLEASLKPSYLNPSNSYRFFSSAQLLEANKFSIQAHQVVLNGLEFNRDSFDLWKLLYLLQSSTDSERNEALQNMKRLDPLNPDVTAN